MNFSESSADLESDSWIQSLEELYPGRNSITIPKGQFIPLLSQEVFVLCRGWVLLSTCSPSGDESLLSLLRPSQLFGRPLTRLVSYNAVALTDVVLIKVLILEIEHSPLLAQSLFRELTQRLQQAEALLRLVHERPVETRLRHLLNFLGAETGERTPQGLRLGVRLTHEQLAAMSRSSRATVTCLIKDFRAEGWLSVDADRHLLIKEV